MLRDVKKDATLSFDDVEQPVRDPLIEKLWREQLARFPQGARPAQEGPRSRGPAEISV